ncbi:MAG: para-nitrobenzyl esterase [Acidimicrobiia bacterium]|nr:para-nitrobenzyl esterase [Acidimicrobiia bacterium]
MAPTVTISSGDLVGRSLGGVDAFLGIPFAAPPVGPLRWRPPAPVQPWSGARDATRLAAAPLQADTTGSPASRLVTMTEAVQDEDCLYLNVWAPTGPAASGRPVLVWIYGGAFVIGSGGQAMYDGARLAAAADAIVVTINYRLGLLGWLRADELGATGNEGLLDQLAALDWVQREISAFGGDPGNVTAFGESAGAISIAAMLSRPGPKPFRKAVLQSGGPNLIQSVERATVATGKLRAQLGADLASWRDLSAAALLDAQNSATPRSAGMFYGPIADGQSVAADPLGAVAAGSAAGIDLLVGTNRDEMGFFLGIDPRTESLTDAVLARTAAGLCGGEERAQRLIDVYRSARSARAEDASARALWIAVASDATFRSGALALADGQAAHASVHAYLFDWVSPAEDGKVGSGHLLEVPFVFGTHRDPTCSSYTGAEKLRGADELAGLMQTAWAAFARFGDPGWPAYEVPARLTQRLGRKPRVEADPYGPERAAWNDVV